MAKRLRDSIESHMGRKGILLVSFVPKRSRIGQEMAELWSRGCVIPRRTTWDKRGSFGVDLYQKDLKSVKTWLSYSHFPIERLHDSIDSLVGQKRILWSLVVICTKKSKVFLEMAAFQVRC